jgi:hypothetical protein
LKKSAGATADAVPGLHRFVGKLNKGDDEQSERTMRDLEAEVVDWNPQTIW